MTDFIVMLILVVLSPAILILTFIFWLIVGGLTNFLFDAIYPSDPPYCDIDPLCHEAFVWDKEGNGWIGNTLVIDK